MAQQQQTVLRVQTNIPNDNLSVTGTCTATVTNQGSQTAIFGSGTEAIPYTGYTISSGSGAYGSVSFEISGSGRLYWEINGQFDFDTEAYAYYSQTVILNHANAPYAPQEQITEYGVNDWIDDMPVIDGDMVTFQFRNSTISATQFTFTFYVIPDNQFTDVYTYDFLDLLGDIPLQINKSFAEVQDIGKKNSDMSIGLKLPGTKKNNKFFENYYNVDQITLFFDVTKRVPINVLINDESYFEGYMRLNSTSVKNSQIEYDVTLFSKVGDLFGKIGTNLLKDLDWKDSDYHFNHYFTIFNVGASSNSILLGNYYPTPGKYIYPIVHNGYLYDGDTVNFTGGTVSSRSNLFTSTKVGAYPTGASFLTDGGKWNRINSSGIYDNQLKPALNIYNLVQLMFKTYGFTIKSDFFNSPWFKLQYMYGYFNSDSSKFSYTVQEYTPPTLYCDDCYEYFLENEQPYWAQYWYRDCVTGEIINDSLGAYQVTQICACRDSVNGQVFVSEGDQCNPLPDSPAIGTVVTFSEQDYVDFSLVVDDTIKQIDFLASLAKKYNLVFVEDPEVPNQLIIEPYEYYIGSGTIEDWTDKLSHDTGFSIEPAQNFIESELILTDLEDGDDGNKQFKDLNNRIYGENMVYNQTDFKSSTKEIKTIFSPEIVRIWDNQITLPLGINYAASNSSGSSGDSEKVVWQYKGLKSKPKIFFFCGNYMPFIDDAQTVYSLANNTNYEVLSMFFRMLTSDGNNGIFLFSPAVISHTFSIGNSDSNKINNDNLSLLFNSELPGDIGIGIDTFNVYTENDLYSAFYSNRVQTLFNKNTRLLKGKFDIKLSDIKNLQAKDIIKIKEQYFTWNKIEQFNLTNPELTQVELLQTDRVVKEYPVRYFKYQYCRPLGNTIEFRFKVEWDSERMRTSNIFWSTLFDYFVGILGGEVKTFFSIRKSLNVEADNYAYSMTEITEDEYNTIPYDESDDPNNLLTSYTSSPLSFNSIFYNRSPIWNVTSTGSGPSGYQHLWLNVGTSCIAIKNTWDTYSDLGLGTPPLPPSVTPTPTLTPTPLPTEGGNPDTPFDVSRDGRGSLLMTYEEGISGQYSVTVNNELRDVKYNDADRLYTTDIYSGDTVSIAIQKDTYDYLSINVYRVEYTTDDEDGDKGIKETLVTGTTLGYGFVGTTLSFNVNYSSITYGFEYRVDINSCFNVGDGFDGGLWELHTSEIYDNWNYVTGGFTLYNGTSVNRIAKIGMDGYLDTTFAFDGTWAGGVSTPSLREIKIYDNYIYAIAYDLDPYQYDYQLIRMNLSDGTLDTGWKSGRLQPTGIGGLQKGVDTMFIDSSGNIYYTFVGTYSNTDNTYTVNGLIKVSQDGTVDQSFLDNIGTGVGLEDLYNPQLVANAREVKLFGNKLYVAGTFNRFNGTSCSSIVRLNLDGTLDSSFYLDMNSIHTLPPFNYEYPPQYDSMDIYSNGYILLGGYYQNTFYNNTVGPVIRLTPNGTLDNTFVLGQSTVEGVSDIVILNDGTFLTSAINITTVKPEVIKHNFDGTIDNTFLIGSAVGPGTALDIQISDNNKIMVVGNFNGFTDGTNTSTANGIVQLNANGAINIC